MVSLLNDANHDPYIRLIVCCLSLLPFAASARQRNPTSFAIAFGSPAVSQDGSMAAVAIASNEPKHRNTVYLFSTLDGHLLLTLPGTRSTASPIAFSPDGKTLAIAEREVGIRIIALPSGADLPSLDDKEGRALSLNSIAYSRDGKYLVASDEYGIRLWDTDTGKVVFDDLKDTDRRSFGLYHVAISPNGEILAATDADNYLEFNWRKNTQSVKPGHVDSFSFRPDGNAIAFISPSRTNNFTIYIRAAATKRIIRSLPAVSGKEVFGSLAYSPNGKFLVLGGGEVLGLLPTAAATIEPLYSQRDVIIKFPQFTSDGKRIVFGILNTKNRNDYKIGVWDIAAHQLLRSIPLPPPPEN